MRCFKTSFHLNDGKNDYQFTLNYDTKRMRVWKRVGANDWKEVNIEGSDEMKQKILAEICAFHEKEGNLDPIEKFVRIVIAMDDLKQA